MMSARAMVAAALSAYLSLAVATALQTRRAPAGTAASPQQAQSRANQTALPEVRGSIAGDPLPGITAQEFERFRLGLDDFLEVEDSEEGLGPVFNGLSCGQCHAIPAIGGSGTITEVRAGVLKEDGTFEELPGGSNFQMFAIPTHSLQPAVPPQANSVAFRKSLPLFGSGLIEAVPDESLIAMEDPQDADGDGIRGRAARVFDRATQKTLVGRFGWKAQQARLITFAAEAYRDEMGITNDLFPLESCPYGVDCDLLAFLDPVPDPEDAPEPSTGLRGIDNFESFLLFLGPPPRGASTPETQAGEAVFDRLRCSACHRPALETGQASSPALSFKRFFPYGDFLLHDIGTGDGIGQADASPREIRTAPLWGLRFRAPYLHDGSADTLDEAIRRHEGEALPIRDAYLKLSDADRAALEAFLRSL